MAIRIDEFRNYAGSGTFTKADLTRLLTFGFDVDITGVVVLGTIFYARDKGAFFEADQKELNFIAPYRGL